MTETFHHTLCGRDLASGAQVLAWGHGWGQSGAAFAKLCASLPQYAHVLLDFPGFGKSALPPPDWGTRDYANATAEKIRALVGDRKVFWIGHSFGGRIGLQLGAHYPEMLVGMCLIASAGLPRPRGFWESLRIKTKIKAFKIAKRLPFSENLKNKFGSPDYKNAGPLRQVFVRVVNEDLTRQAQEVRMPVLLIYGSEDTETPPVIGERLHALIKDSKLVLLDGFDHYSVLDQGRHLVVKHLAGRLRG